MERDNRKSHLAPQLSPSTQDFLRARDSPPSHPEERSIPTPTSGEIPIAGTGYVSSRDHYPPTSNRSPTRNSAGVSRNAPSHPGIVRGPSNNSIPKVGGYPESPSYSGSPTPNTFNLPVRPAPPSGPLPTPPVRKPTPDDLRRGSREPREVRRQPAYGLPPNPAYNV